MGQVLPLVVRAKLSAAVEWLASTKVCTALWPGMADWVLSGPKVVEGWQACTATSSTYQPS